MHGEEQKWVDEAIRTNWVSTVGENINEVERLAAEKIGRRYAVGLATGTASLHLAVKLAGEKLYGQPKVGHGVLEGKKVFCSDMTFDATVNPVAYEGGEAVFIDTEYETWNMDPAALERAFELYPEVRLIVIAHLYGTPGNRGCAWSTDRRRCGGILWCDLQRDTDRQLRRCRGSVLQRQQDYHRKRGRDSALRQPGGCEQGSKVVDSKQRGCRLVSA